MINVANLRSLCGTTTAGHLQQALTKRRATAAVVPAQAMLVLNRIPA